MGRRSSIACVVAPGGERRGAGVRRVVYAALLGVWALAVWGVILQDHVG